MTDATTTTSDKGELLMLPAELWQSIDEACQAAAAAEAGAAEDQEDAAARTAFGQTFAKALHARGLVLVSRARSDSRETVSADAYSLALAGKHTAERELHALRQLLLGWTPCPEPLLAVFVRGLLALTGRAPPDDKRLLWQALLRLRGAAALAGGKGHVGEIEPFPPELVSLVGSAATEDQLAGDAGAGEAIR